MLASFHSVGLMLPNGRSLFQDLDLALEPGRTGLVGPNGAGKSTLARLLAGQSEPSTGRIDRPGGWPFFFAQDEPRPACTVGEWLLDIWAFTAPSALALRDRFLSRLQLETPCALLSGGEWTRARLLRALASGHAWLILDEPTNSLDRDGREAVIEFVRDSGIDTLVISHDRELLGHVDRILELGPRGLSAYGGDWEEYWQQREFERAAFGRSVENARRERDAAERSRAERIERQARRQREGARKAARGGTPRILLGMMKRRAEGTAARVDSSTSRAVDEAVQALAGAQDALKFDPAIYAEFPRAAIPASRGVMEASGLQVTFGGRPVFSRPLTFYFAGPARVRLTGPNGRGKSTLLRALFDRLTDAQVEGTVRLGAVSAAYLDQDLSALDPESSVLECFVRHAPRTETEARNLLARFLFQRDHVRTPVRDLSGGERMRLALAIALAAEPPAQLLMLDEPTLHLDLANVGFLEEALRRYPGALLVVTHDEVFAREIGVDAEIKLG